MATGGHVPEIDVLINLHQAREADDHEEESLDKQKEEEEDWEKALSVECFADIISDSASASADKMGRNYTEKDFEYHRHTIHHIHHPLSTHLPVPQRLRKRVHSMDRRRRKKRKKKKTSLPPSEVTPTIHEVDEEEVEPEVDPQKVATDLPSIEAQITKCYLPCYLYFEDNCPTVCKCKARWHFERDDGQPWSRPSAVNSCF
ncbi:anion exchange protein 3-like [Entelurus aequoreus]|uniref:anion exchange protein 3-like n=1 Tax=Entelurus aequoreus TaxID=161455 RepID=UPI002B1E3A33|nr:anion exchange protein 3-like [Entelurus aequoreus]